MIRQNQVVHKVIAIRSYLDCKQPRYLHAHPVPDAVHMMTHIVLTIAILLVCSGHIHPTMQFDDI